MSKDWQKIKLLRKIAGSPEPVEPKRLDIPDNVYYVSCNGCGYEGFSEGVGARLKVAKSKLKTYTCGVCKNISWTILGEVK